MNTDLGLLFPGQGSQSVGMGADLYDRYPKARDVFDRATDILEFDIKKLCFEGPDELLRQTRNTQPAILTHSLAVLALLPEMSPACVAGHSLGEYSALYAAGVLDLLSVLKLGSALREQTGDAHVRGGREESRYNGGDHRARFDRSGAALFRGPGRRRAGQLQRATPDCHLR